MPTTGPVSPQRAEVLSLRRSVRLAEEGHADACTALARERARRKATEAAHGREHEARAQEQALYEIQYGIFQARLAEGVAVNAKGAAMNAEIKKELFAARDDERVTVNVLTGVASELDRALLDAIPLKSPQDSRAFLERLRAMIPIERPAASAAVAPQKSVTVQRDARGVIVGAGVAP